MKNPYQRSKKLKLPDAADTKALVLGDIVPFFLPVIFVVVAELELEME